ncbi:MAG TPA: FlgD immunoglobulin-like domain containing protein [Gaiellaceae bacterium]|nr:FlgD immunoglobulin-like domain containing protein [Gaiellaceae bacterium]
MARIVSTVLVVALLAGTAAAFAWTEVLKLQPTPIRAVQVPTRVFSPVCECETETATFRLRLREADVLDVSVVDASGSVVSTIATGDRRPAGWAEYSWNGRDGAGRVLPEGVYRPRVHLREERETIVLPNDIRIDVTPPEVVEWDVRPRVFSPDGDGRADRVIVTYRAGEEARGMLFVDGERRAYARFARSEDRLPWFGLVDGEPLPAGLYDFQLAVHDPAGNVSVRTEPIPVRIRYVALGRERVEVRAGSVFAIRVSSDARTVRWRLGAASGEAAPGTLRLRAPRQKGRFTLTVTANGYSARAAIFVREAPR